MLILVYVGLSTAYLMQIVDDQDACLGIKCPCYFCNKNDLIDPRLKNKNPKQEMLMKPLL